VDGYRWGGREERSGCWLECVKTEDHSHEDRIHRIRAVILCDRTDRICDGWHRWIEVDRGAVERNCELLASHAIALAHLRQQGKAWHATSVHFSLAHPSHCLLPQTWACRQTWSSWNTHTRIHTYCRRPQGVQGAADAARGQA